MVHEGQDFEADWWPLLELAMSDGADGIHYVFRDDAQRLLRQMNERRLEEQFCHERR